MARSLLRYGIEVARRLEAQRLAEPWQWEKPLPDEPADLWPQVAEIDARLRPMTPDELREHGYGQWYDDFHGDEEGEPDTP